MANSNIEARSWSLAVHGGAGSAPESWTPQKRQARQTALRKALTTGRDCLARGGSAVEAVEAAVIVLEDDGSFHAGRGATLTSAGTVELDASIMDGSDARCGAVAGIAVAKNPVVVARRVMDKTEHVLLVGSGADAFSLAQGIPKATADDFFALGRQAERLASDQSGDDESQLRFGTVGCVARDSDSNLAAATSTSGTQGKLPGRVGDSPIIGAGTFAANDAGAISATGLGEEFMRRCVAYDLVAVVRYTSRTLAQAAEEVMRDRLPPSTGGLIAVDAAGEIVLVHNTPGMSYGAADSSGRFDVALRVQ